MVPGELQQTKQVAARQEIPEAFLNKIIQLLSKAGLVQTSRGAQGGVKLAKPSEEITLRQVIEAVEGPIALNRCLTGTEPCPREKSCLVHNSLAHVQDVLVNELDKITIGALLAQKFTSESTLQKDEEVV
jgi:Rrf2 family protein